MMMEAEIYGLTPSKAIDKFSKAPPVKILNKPKTLLCSIKLLIWVKSTSGIGIAAIKRKTNNQNKIASKFLRKSLFLNNFIKFFIIINF